MTGGEQSGPPRAGEIPVADRNRDDRPFGVAPPLSAGARKLASRAPTAIATVTVLIGILAIVTALNPEQPSRLETLTRVVPLGFAQTATAATAVAGVLLVMLGHGLRRRKRRAWRLAIALSLVIAVLHLARGLDVEESAASLFLVVLLISLSREFYASGDPRTRLGAPIAFVCMLAASFGIGYLLLIARAESIVGDLSVVDRLKVIAYGLVGLAGPVSYHDERTPDVVFAVLGLLGAATVLVTAYLALRAPEPSPSLTDSDESRLRDLLGAHGDRDSLGYFALRDDKSVIFSPSGKAAVSYRVLSGVMLASGDPLGDPEAWPAAIDVFVDKARRHAWVPAVIGCSQVGAEVWTRETGLRALELGDEAVLDIADFSLEGRPMRNIRQMVRRVERDGYLTEVRRVGDTKPEVLDEIRRTSDAWRGAEVERGFSMALGRFGSPSDPDCVVVTAYRDSQLAAVLSFVPWGADGLSLDVMRRDRAADAGLNELMIVAMTRAAPDLGVSQLSLNFSVFRAALDRGGRLGAGPVLRAWRSILMWLSRWFQIESLFRFNAKFRPTWEPRFICYPRSADLPRITVAALEAEAFIVHPRRWMSLRWTGRRASNFEASTAATTDA